MTTVDPTLQHPTFPRTGSINLANIGSSAVFVPVGIAEEPLTLRGLLARIDTVVSGGTAIFGYIPSGTGEATGNVVALTSALDISATADTNLPMTVTVDGSGFPTQIPAGAAYGFQFNKDVTGGKYFSWRTMMSAPGHFPSPAN